MSHSVRGTRKSKNNKARSLKTGLRKNTEISDGFVNTMRASDSLQDFCRCTSMRIYTVIHKNVAVHLKGSVQEQHKCGFSSFEKNAFKVSHILLDNFTSG